MGDGRSLAETPTWAVATVVSVMVGFGFLFHESLKHFGKWLYKTKRKSLLSALQKIKEELMLFGLLSLLMGHSVIYVAKICVKSSTVDSTRFYPCLPETNTKLSTVPNHLEISRTRNWNHSVLHELVHEMKREYCPEGQESFASKESLEQLHRFLFVLGVIHVSYSFAAIAFAMIKIYSWRAWENQAKSMVLMEIQGTNSLAMRRLSSFIFNHTSHPWSKHKVLIYLLCFSRQFYNSIKRADYMALRLGFISTHELPLLYDFHSYMLRSMEEEFRDIVGISVPLWIFATVCVFLGFHGTNIYFWLSFVPAILILAIGTKLHYIVAKLALEITSSSPPTGVSEFKLRDELFWFGNPRLLLRLIQFISFQVRDMHCSISTRGSQIRPFGTASLETGNAFEMAMFIWSLWESSGASCFMSNHILIAIRLTFGIVSQFWFSFLTFPLYVIVTQMGSRFKKSIVSEGVRESLHRWQKRVKTRHGHRRSVTSTTLSDYTVDTVDRAESLPIETSSLDHDDLNFGSSKYFYATDVLDRVESATDFMGHESGYLESSRYFSAGDDHSYLLDEEDQSSEISLTEEDFQGPPFYKPFLQ